jgi:heat-inducible transcriptional repressor
VQHRIIEIPVSITGSDLATISALLNAKLYGYTMESIRFTLIKEIYLELSRHKHILDLVLEVLRYSLMPETEEKVYLGGLLNILSQPEFHNIEKLKTLLSLLEQENLLSGLMSPAPEQSGITVRIGEEMSFEGMQDCSMVVATYGVDGQPVGSLGVIGPIRMDYAKVIGVVEYMTENLSYALERLLKGVD